MNLPEPLNRTPKVVLEFPERLLSCTPAAKTILRTRTPAAL